MEHYDLNLPDLDPLDDGYSGIQLIDHMGSDASVVRAARVSYAGDVEDHDPERDEKLIYYLARHNHGTPFEHTAVTFHVELPIAVVRQWHRHRIASYNEISRRYTSESVEFHFPEAWRGQSNSNRQASDGLIREQFAASEIYGEALDLCKSAYERLLELGVAREQARMVLPQSLYTRMYVTGNLRSYAHFYALRADQHAQEEIRKYAEAMGKILSALYPISWSALTEPGT